MVLASLFGVLLSFPATVLGVDFDTSSNDWNGLSEFYEALQGRGEVSQGAFDWSELRTEDVVVLIYPLMEQDVQSLSRFVLRGGRVLLADDFGASTTFLDRLSIQRAEPDPRDLPHQRFVENEPGWPILRPQGRHPLLEGVEEVVANYPAVLYNVGGPVLSYDEEGGLVYDMLLGEGRVLVFGDPAIFLNGMLAIADNRQLMENSLDYLCPEDPCRFFLLQGEDQTRGQFLSSEDSLSGDQLVSQVQSLNRQIREAFRELPQTGLLSFLALFLVLGSTAYLLTVFPWRKLRPLSDYIHRSESSLAPPLTEYDWNISRYREEQGKLNYALPAAILKEVVEQLLRIKFNGEEEWKWQDFQPHVERSVLENIGDREERRRKGSLREISDFFSGVPPREEVFLGGEKRIDKSTFLTLHQRVLEVLRWLELQDEYERITGERGGGERRQRRSTSRRDFKKLR